MLGMFAKAVQSIWKVLRNGFWFLPVLISSLGPLLVLLMLAIDHAVKLHGLPFLFSGSSTAASNILSTIAGSLITVAGLTFSITILVLQVVASQFTPRALPSFLGDRLNQAITGGFLGIFLYALLVLSAVRDPQPPDPGFVPVISITGAIGLGFLGLMFLLIFIHHTGEVIQVSHITARLAKQTQQAIERRYPWRTGELLDEDSAILLHTWNDRAAPVSLYATVPGYVQSITFGTLLKALARPGLQVHLKVCPGDFVTVETVIAEIWPAEAVDKACRRAIKHNIHLERERDMYQDIRFGIRQLADIALRALSPAINDPTTGVICIKYLQAVFENLVRQAPQTGVYRFADGTSVLVARYPTFEECMEVFVEIGRYATGNARVVTTILAVLARLSEIATSLHLQESQDVLARVASAVATPAIAEAPSDIDDTRIREGLKSVEQSIQKRYL